MKIKTLFIFAAFTITCINAQRAYQDDTDDDVEEAARLAMNRAISQPVIDDSDRMPSKSKKAPLMQRFIGNSIANAAW